MDVGAKVGDEFALGGEGNVDGSKSRSGTVGVTNGRFVVRRRRTRSSALSLPVSMLPGLDQTIVLHEFQEDDTSPLRLLGELPPQAHLNHEFGVLDDFQSP